MSQICRKHLKFTGYVQGVGFRYRAKYGANTLGVTGWVCNEWDDSVVMEVQGTQKQINDLLVFINRSEYIRIDDIDTKEIPIDESETGFHVRD